MRTFEITVVIEAVDADDDALQRARRLVWDTVQRAQADGGFEVATHNTKLLTKENA